LHHETDDGRLTPAEMLFPESSSGESVVIHPARPGRATLRAADLPTRPEPTAEEFLARWATESAAIPLLADAASSEAALSGEDLAAVARHVAPLFGDRPLGGLTFGELAALPALLEAHGFAPEASRAACRALGSAIRAELLAWPDTRH
jgi:hypothetical protein